MSRRRWEGANDLRSLLRPIGKLREDPENARRHSESNRRAIEATAPAQRADDLFFEYSRLLEELSPRAFVAENWIEGDHAVGNDEYKIKWGSLSLPHPTIMASGPCGSSGWVRDSDRPSQDHGPSPA